MNGTSIRWLGLTLLRDFRDSPLVHSSTGIHDSAYLQ